MACESDFTVIVDLLLVIAGVRAQTEKNTSDNNEGEEVEPTLYAMYDNERACSGFGFLLLLSENGRNCEVKRRRVILHALLHGSLDVVVLDFICLSCDKMFFDGRDAALFACSRTVACSRDLLDFWLYHVTMLSGTFRGGYELSKSVSGSVSAMYRRMGKR